MHFRTSLLLVCYNDCTSGNQAYTVNFIHADLPQLSDRREQLTRRFFVKMMMMDIDNYLNSLLPSECDSEIFGSLRMVKEYPLLYANTSRFNKSFLPYALSNYQ